MRNRIHNSSNPYQGDAKKVLCVCSAGLLRSPTIANILHRDWGYNTRAAGISPDFALIVVDDVLLSWADEIVCVDEAIKLGIQKQLNVKGFLNGDTPVYSLNIPDSYAYMDDKLQKIIHEAYNELKIK